MINWIKYDPTDRSIESHVTHLVLINGKEPQVAQHAKLLAIEGYGWHVNGGYRLNGVTHWSPINLPEEGTTE